jgi:hypothetical protein
LLSYLPMVLLVLLLGSWIFLLFQLRRLLGWNIGGYWLVLFALVQVYFLTLLAPDRLQTIYWRMGMLHYSLPLPLLLIQLGLVMRWAAQPQRSLTGVSAAIFLLAFFAGGNSETFAFLQFGLWSLAILAALVLMRGMRRMRISALVLAPLGGSLLALVVMFFSPQNADRLAVMPPPDNLLLIIPYTLRFVAAFIYHALRGQITPFIVFVLTIGVISFLAFRAQKPLLSLRAALRSLFLSLLVMLVLIAASIFPSVYAGLLYPAGRALMPAAFALLIGLSAAIFFAAEALRHLTISRKSWLPAAALLLLMLVSFYPFRAASVQRYDLDRLSVWAERWDTRDQQIRQSLADGTNDVLAREIEVVWSLEDMGPNPSHWINRCAAILYGAHSITANP